MNKKTKQLLKQNNILQNQLDKTDGIILTDIVVYLRGSDINEYNQELVRRDILQMLKEAHYRGDNIEKVIGGDYKTFCDEIIDVFPKKSAKDKFLDYLGIALTGIVILGVIQLAEQFILTLLKKQTAWTFSLTYGKLLIAAIIIAASVGIVNYTCKTAFTNAHPKKLTVFIIWLALCAFFALMYLISKILSAVMFTMPMLAAAAIIAVLYVIQRLVNNIN